jgi:uncharacterized membrane protein HdeD (DUF308 family)
MDRRYRIWLAVRGVAAIIFGILAVIWPGLTIVALALLFGVFALVDGVSMLIDAFRGRRSGGQRTAYAIGGVLGIGAGLLTMLWPGITALVLVTLIGAWAFVTGVLDIWAAAAAPARPGWLLVLVGILSLIAGALIVIRPAVGAIAIARVIGFYAIITGVLMLIEMWRLSRDLREPTARPAPAGT